MRPVKNDLITPKKKEKKQAEARRVRPSDTHPVKMWRPPSSHVYFFAVVSSPRSQQHLSSSTFKCFNLRESQYPPQEQAGLLSRGQFETEYLNTLPASICWQLHQRNIHQQVRWTDLKPHERLNMRVNQQDPIMDRHNIRQ